jgi:hypothetical protein
MSFLQIPASKPCYLAVSIQITQALVLQGEGGERGGGGKSAWVATGSSTYQYAACSGCLNVRVDGTWYVLHLSDMRFQAPLPCP